MFVMVMSVRRSNTVTETVPKEINISNQNNLINLKSINSFNNQLNIIQNTTTGKLATTNTNCCTIDKTIKHILPITVDTTTILSPSALTAAQSAQNSNKFLLTELNNYRKPPTIQVRWKSNIILFNFPFPHATTFCQYLTWTATAGQQYYLPNLLFGLLLFVWMTTIFLLLLFAIFQRQMLLSGFTRSTFKWNGI